MRAILVGALVAVVGTASAALAGGMSGDADLRAERAARKATVVAPTVVEREQRTVHQAPPFRHIVVEEYHNAGAEFGMGIASSLLSLIYSPFRMGFGLAGAGLGGFTGWSTGGDLRAARAVWRPTVEGDYFVRPDHLDGTERFEFSNVRPVVRERYTIRGPATVVLPEAGAVSFDQSAQVVEVPAEVEVEVQADSNGDAALAPDYGDLEESGEY